MKFASGKKMSKIDVAGCSALIAMTAILPGVAYGKDMESPASASDMPADSVDSGNDIIVTATKRERTLQDVPVAVTVTTREIVEREHIQDLKDLATTSPSLRVGERQSSSGTNFFIRGFGNGASNPGIEPSVGVFIDGVYRSRTAAQVADLPDIDRIEILRGPQSTLFGKNASAGVISITTQRPQFDFGGNIEASYGNYDARVLRGTLTGPVTDSLAVSVSGGVNRRDGIVRDEGTGARNNNRNRWFARGQLLFKPDDRLSLRLIADYGRINEACCAVVNVQQSAATTAIRAVGGQVNAPEDRFENIAYSNLTPVNRIENYGLSGQIDYVVAGIALTSITAVRRTDSYNRYDPDFSSADVVGMNIFHPRVKTFTQELRATADLSEGVSALLSASYFHEKINDDSQVLWGSAARGYADLLIRGATRNTLNVSALETMLGAAAGDRSLFAGRFFAAGQGLTENYRLDNQAVSLSAQVDVELTSRLTATGGLNYTHDSKRFAANVTSNDVFSSLKLPAALAALQPLQYFPPFLNLPNAVENGRTSDGDLLWTARLSYEATRSIKIYAGVATGFKASSINLSRDSRPAFADRSAIVAAGIAVPNQSYGARFADPENAISYEAGLKANWGVVTANVALFKQSIKGFQSNVWTGTGYFLGNAGQQSVFGIETEATVRPVEELTLGVAWTYLDPRYDSFPNSAFGDATGLTPANIPALSATFSAQYAHALGNRDRLILYSAFRYESPVQTVEGLPAFITRNPATGAVLDYQTGLAAARAFKREVNELNGSVTYAMANGLELSLWGRNLLDDRYVTAVFDSIAQTGSVSAYVNQPRSYGGTIRFRW
jgi:outer membrane receptor protein involved in Fe transport